MTLTARNVGGDVWLTGCPGGAWLALCPATCRIGARRLRSQPGTSAASVGPSQAPRRSLVLARLGHAPQGGSSNRSATSTRTRLVAGVMGPKSQRRHPKKCRRAVRAKHAGARRRTHATLLSRTASVCRTEVNGPIDTPVSNSTTLATPSQRFRRSKVVCLQIR